MANIWENSKKLNEYDFYHICVYNKNGIFFEKFDLSFKEIFNKINEIIDEYEFIVIATLEKIDDSLRYVNTQYLMAGIISQPLLREDVFKSKERIFVSCTDYFRKLCTNT